jgi:hypothetical protein
LEPFGGAMSGMPSWRSPQARNRLRFLGDLRVEVVPAREDVMIARAVRELLSGAP